VRFTSESVVGALLRVIFGVNLVLNYESVLN